MIYSKFFVDVKEGEGSDLNIQWSTLGYVNVPSELMAKSVNQATRSVLLL